MSIFKTFYCSQKETLVPFPCPSSALCSALLGLALGWGLFSSSLLPLCQGRPWREGFANSNASTLEQPCWQRGWDVRAVEERLEPSTLKEGMEGHLATPGCQVCSGCHGYASRNQAALQHSDGGLCLGEPFYMLPNFLCSSLKTSGVP